MPTVGKLAYKKIDVRDALSFEKDTKHETTIDWYELEKLRPLCDTSMAKIHDWERWHSELTCSKTCLDWRGE